MTTPAIPLWQLRARFAAALSQMYGTEVPAYTTLLEVSTAVNRDYAATHPHAHHLGSLERVSAERHGAIRVGTPAELADIADLFAAFGMYPVGFYDLRGISPTSTTSPIPVISTAFRPINSQELARNPFRVFISLLATGDSRFFSTDLCTRITQFLNRRQLCDPDLITTARRIAANGGCSSDEANDVIARATATFALSSEPIDRSWYEELTAVSPVAADIAGVTRTHINHLTPRVLDIDALYQRMISRGITMIDAIQGPPPTPGPPVLLRQTSFRALAEPRRFRNPDGTITPGALRVRFGEVEARGVALTPKGRRHYDTAMATADPAACWNNYFPATDTEMAAQGLAYYHRGNPAAPVVYEDFLPTSAAGIFHSNLDHNHTSSADTTTGAITDPTTENTPNYTMDWMAGAINRTIYNPYDLYTITSQEPPA